MYKAEIRVTLKKTVNDPQGLTIKSAIHQLGFAEVDTIRAGKYIEVWLEATSQADAEKKINAMCDRLLANTVIEEYDYSVYESKTTSANT